MRIQRSSFLSLAIVLFGVVGASPAAFGQSTTLLRGTISDPQGKAIAEAVVKLSNAKTGVSRQVLTGANGEYQFLQLSPGAYDVVVEMPGFSKLSRSDVNVPVNTPTTLDMHLEIGQT